MPPRHVYWTIIYGNQATSFRAATPEELLPTLKQLQSRHPDAVMKYFARGKLWNSAEEARPRRDDPRRTDRPRTDRPRDERPRVDRPRDDRWRDARRPDDRRRDDRRPEHREARNDRERRTGTQKPAGERRGKDWRPGGEHRDPRDRWKVPRDVKRKRFAQRLRQDRMTGHNKRPPNGRRRPPKKGDDE